LARAAKPIEQSDEAIRAQLLAELSKQSWAPLAVINPIVREGVVELWGTITDERERRALVVAAENVPGVKAVRDQLAWIDVTSGMVVYQPEEPAPATKAS
jgi:osmotically-inducible protein OsmY